MTEDWQNMLLRRLERGGWADVRIYHAGGPSTEVLRRMKRGENVRRDSWDKLQEALESLDGLEESMPPPLPPVEGRVFPSDESKIRRIELSGVYGVDRIYVEDRDDTDPSELERRIAAIIRGVKKGAGEGENDAGSN